MPCEKAMGRRLGHLGRGDGGVLGPQPVTEVFDGTNGRVDGVGGEPAPNEEFDKRVEELAKWIAAQPPDVMTSSEECVEHGCPPGRTGKSQGEHPDYGEPRPAAGHRGQRTRQTEQPGRSRRLCMTRRSA